MAIDKLRQAYLNSGGEQLEMDFSSSANEFKEAIGILKQIL